MATFKEFGNQDIKTDRDVLMQPVDILQSDISGSLTRRKYQHFVTGGIGPGITSSLWQTIYDQDFTLQTANALMDVTFGLSANSDLVSGSRIYLDSTTGKSYFPSQSVQMREKMDIYRQMSQQLLGNASKEFLLVSGSTTNYIREPMFVCMKRLMSRDRIQRETFGIKIFQSSSYISGPPAGAKIYTDAGSSGNKELSFGGQVSTIVDSSNTAYPVGLLYLDRGIAVLDTQRVFAVSQSFSGSIHAVNASGLTNFNGTMNQFIVSASMDDLIDHVCSTRFSSSNETAMVFQSQTILNSTMYFCKFDADDYNYSSNPTYTDSNNRIVVIDPGQEDVQKPFTFVTSIGGYDAHGNCLWVAKLSRPNLKDSQRSFIIKCKMDF